jgi:raffinose/stachyose/melibiose transport system permease protein
MLFGRKRRRSHYGSGLGIFLFLLPGVGVYTVLMLYPSLLSLYYSVLDWEGGPVGNAPFVGLDNFREAFKDPVVPQALANNARVLFLNWAFQLPVALILAFTLSRLRHGAALYRFLFFIPVILPVATLALLWRFVFSGNQYGLLNNALREAGREDWIRLWLSGDGIVQWTTSFPMAWQFIGFFMVIFLAALAGIPEEYYEAAALDGASAWRQLRDITLPGIKPVYVSAMILSLQIALGAYIYPILMTEGGPLHRSETMISYSIYLLWVKRVWGYGSAIAALTFLLTIVVSTLIWRIGRRQERLVIR